MITGVDKKNRIKNVTYAGSSEVLKLRLWPRILPMSMLIIENSIVKIKSSKFLG
jgi:hypothetical protein